MSKGSEGKDKDRDFSTLTKPSPLVWIARVPQGRSSSQKNFGFTHQNEPNNIQISQEMANIYSIIEYISIIS